MDQKNCETDFAKQYNVEKRVFYGDKYLREQKQTIDNPFWREVIESTYGLRLNIRPSWDYAFLSWPLWHDNLSQLPKINA